MTGTGTQDDPFIVDNWEDFKTATAYVNYGKYVKWADSENNILKLEDNSSDSVSINSAQVDFNGWTFVINKHPYNLMLFRFPYGTAKNAQFIVDLIALNSGGVLLSVSDESTGNGIFTFERIYISVSVSDATSNPFYCFYTGYGSGNGFIIVNNSIISIALDNDSPIELGMGDRAIYQNCEFLIKCSGKDKYGIYNFGKDSDLHGSNSSSFQLYNCYIGGHISAATSEGVNFKINTDYINNTVINLSSSNIPEIEILGQSYGYPNIWVTNTSVSIRSDANIVYASPDEIKNEDFLKSTGIEYILDDNVRNPQFGDSTDESWTFRQNSKVNNGILFLPFWKYPVPSDEEFNVYIGGIQIKEIFYGSKPITAIYYGKQKIY